MDGYKELEFSVIKCSDRITGITPSNLKQTFYIGNSFTSDSFNKNKIEEWDYVHQKLVRVIFKGDYPIHPDNLILRPDEGFLYVYGEGDGIYSFNLEKNDVREEQIEGVLKVATTIDSTIISTKKGYIFRPEFIAEKWGSSLVDSGIIEMDMSGKYLSLIHI